MTTKKDYFRKWYYTHGGAALLSTRRKAQKADPEHVKKLREEARARRKKERAERTPTPPAPEVVTRLVDGRLVRLYSIGEVAARVSVAAVTLRSWELRGKIAATPHRDARGGRLYTDDQILLIEAAASDRVRTQPPRPKPDTVTERVRWPDGRVTQETLFRVGVLAEKVGRSVAAVSAAITRGNIPQTPLVSPGGQRLYTQDMADALQAAYVQGDTMRYEDAWEVLCASIAPVWRRYEGCEVVP